MEQVNKINDTEIEIIDSNVTTTIYIPLIKIALEEDTKSLNDLEVRYVEQKSNLENLIAKNTEILDKAENVGVN